MGTPFAVIYGAYHMSEHYPHAWKMGVALSLTTVWVVGCSGLCVFCISDAYENAVGALTRGKHVTCGTRFVRGLATGMYAMLALVCAFSGLGPLVVVIDKHIKQTKRNRGVP